VQNRENEVKIFSVYPWAGKKILSQIHLLLQCPCFHHVYYQLLYSIFHNINRKPSCNEYHMKRFWNLQKPSSIFRACK
jgi:hypothetical protein